MTCAGRGLSFWIVSALFCFVTVFTEPAHAQENVIDQATVRVLCSNGFAVEKAKLGGTEAALAVPQLVHGSGFVAGKKGVIVTAQHVVADAKFVVVWIPGVEKPLPAKVVHQDSDLDVAFLRVLEKVPVRADWKNAKKLDVRQKIFAVGYPLDATRSDAQSFEGSVSSLMPDGNLQLSLSVNAGNSGGPIVDEKGRVHAIVTKGANAKAGVTGMAIATPVSSFKQELTREVFNARQGELAGLGQEAALVAAELLVLEQSATTSLLALASDVHSAGV